MLGPLDTSYGHIPLVTLVILDGPWAATISRVGQVLAERRRRQRVVPHRVSCKDLVAGWWHLRQLGGVLRAVVWDG